MTLKRLTALWLGACALLGLALLVARGLDAVTPKVYRDAPKPAEAPTPPPVTPPVTPSETPHPPSTTAPPAASRDLEAPPGLVRLPRAPRPTAAGAEAHDSDPPAAGVDPSIPLSADGVSSVLPQLRASIAECIDAWAEVDPSISGSVVLRFTLGPKGVQDAWVSERQDMPLAVTGCFSGAVYEQAWPPAPGGVEVSLPF
jgi:hypothetical protein